jgi:hypothetical protein
MTLRKLVLAVANLGGSAAQQMSDLGIFAIVRIDNAYAAD